MNIEIIKSRFISKLIYLSENELLEKPTVIGYEKKFKWSWLATQLNTFIIVSDFGDIKITPQIIENHITAGFQYAKNNYTGWPRGLQSGLGVISILISSEIDQESIQYCKKLKSGKKWAGFTIPVTVNSSSQSVYYFDKNPMWGRIYYPHFKKLIIETLKPLHTDYS
jgi:hypothetical protein